VPYLQVLHSPHGAGNHREIGAAGEFIPSIGMAASAMVPRTPGSSPNPSNIRPLAQVCPPGDVLAVRVLQGMPEYGCCIMSAMTG
jgi:hypothetical protein